MDKKSRITKEDLNNTSSGETDTSLFHSIYWVIGRFRLRTVLTISLVLVLIISMGITGVLAFFNSQYAIHDLSGQLQNEVSERIEQHLDTYLQTPHLINRLCEDLITTRGLDIHDRENLKKTFQKLSYQFNTVTSICFGSELDGNYSIISVVGKPGVANGTDRFWAISPLESRNFSYEEYLIDKSGKIIERTLSYPHYDPRTRPWYQMGVNASGPAWTPVFMWLEVGAVSMDAVLPVYSEKRELLGIMDTSLSLTGIGTFLQELRISPHGQAYIIEKTGEILASSTVKEPYLRGNGELIRLIGTESSDPMIQKSALEVMAYVNSSEKSHQISQFSFDLYNERHFVQVTPYQGPYGLEWYIVVIIPESDFMGRIYSNNISTAILFLLSIIGTIILCIYLGRWITVPISSMNQSAKSLAQGDWNQWKELDRKDELGELSQTFKQMADQLHESFTSLKSSEERYSNLFQSSADAIFLTDGQSLVEMNQAGEVMFGMSGEDSKGNDITDIFGKTGSEIVDMIQSSTVTTPDGYKDKTISRFFDEEEQYMNIRIKRLSTEYSSLYLVHIRDITDQRKAIFAFAEQESLREAYSEAQLILKHLPDPTFVINTEGKVLLWNKAIEKMTGVKAEEIIGEEDYAFAILKKKRPILVDLALNPKLPYKTYYPNLEINGDELWTTFRIGSSGDIKYYSALAARLYDKKGNLIGAIESIRDITSYKLVEEALRNANKKLTLLSNITRHDIKNKIAISKGYVYFLNITSLNDDQKNSLNSLDRSLTDIENIIAFTKTYQEIGLNTPIWQDVGKAFAHAVTQANPGEVPVINTIEGISILADPLFEKVCYTLMENALRHGKDLTMIQITSEETESGLRITFQDNGSGIPDEDKEYIFEKGFGKNTGYGLFLAREILALSEITIAEHGKYGVSCIFDIDVPKGRYRREW